MNLVINITSTGQCHKEVQSIINLLKDNMDIKEIGGAIKGDKINREFVVNCK